MNQWTLPGVARGSAKVLLTLDTDLNWRIAGALIRLAGRTSTGRALVRLGGAAVGSAMAGAGVFGARESDDMRVVAGGFMAIMAGLGCRFEAGRQSADEVEVFMLACPGKLDTPQTCLAGMEADRAVVRRLGGDLRIEETLLTGAPRCRLRVVRRRDGCARRP